MGNLILVVLSIIFYAWAIAIDALKLILYVILLYCIGRTIESLKKKHSISEKNKYNSAKWLTAAGVVLAIGLLYYFKYSSTVTSQIAGLFSVDTSALANITAPLGISFLTFSTISYYVDIYRGDATAGSLLDCLTYIFFFPKVISGPIVLWKEFQPQLHDRRIDSDAFVMGMNRIAIGFGKKLILADTLGSALAANLTACVDTPTAWLCWLAYGLQIYYDFSGYSDIAIGLAKIFGFQFHENFNFPYRSLSVAEFWRRWHISLGSFFKNYIYIPLGGNRKGKTRTLINLGVVFLVTGLWHGVGIGYVLWGAIHGACVIIERLISDQKWYKKIPSLIKWAVTFFIVTTTWQVFRYSGDLHAAAASAAHLFGIHSYTAEQILFPWQYYINTKVLVLMIIGLIGATILGNERIAKMYYEMKKNTVFYIISEVVVVMILLTAVLFMSTSTYNPFIYFQF